MYMAGTQQVMRKLHRAHLHLRPHQNSVQMKYCRAFLWIFLVEKYITRYQETPSLRG